MDLFLAVRLDRFRMAVMSSPSGPCFQLKRGRRLRGEYKLESGYSDWSDNKVGIENAWLVR
jgi:hypothetical protein